MVDPGELDLLHLHISEHELHDLSNDAVAAPPMDIAAAEDSDSDDGISITIDAERLAIKRLIEGDGALEYGPRAAASHDIALKSEIEAIVRASVHPNSSDCVLGLVNNALIPISRETPISDRLAAHLWRQARPYVASVLPHQDIFNEQIRRIEGSATEQRRHRNCFAIFAAHYERLSVLQATVGRVANSRPKHRRADSGQASTALASGSAASSSTNIYRYTDFAALVIRDGRVVDFAVHGAISNINEMLRTHAVERVYYNAHLGDSLNTFMEYECQPFYETCSKISRPMPMYRGTSANINTTAFCPLCDPFCALCCALKDTYAFMNNADVPNERRLVYGHRSLSLLDPARRDAPDDSQRQRRRTPKIRQVPRTRQRGRQAVRPYDVQERQRKAASLDTATLAATRRRPRPPAFNAKLRTLRPTRL